MERQGRRVTANWPIHAEGDLSDDNAQLIA